MKQASYQTVYMVRQGLELLPAFTCEQTNVKLGMMARLDEILTSDPPEAEETKGGCFDGNDQ